MTWTTIAANWNHGCAVESHARPAVDPGLAFTVLRTACEPYLRGMRHYALPSVSFDADGELISAPGDRLPSSGDSDLDGYRDRLSSRAANWRLRAVEPLFTDYRLWHRVREQLTPLWSIVGMPVLPVASELIVAAGDVGLCESEASHLNLVFVLDGRVTLLDDGTEQELSEGDVVRIPAAGTAALRSSTASLSLRLRIPVDRRLPTADAVRLISRVVAAEAAELDEPVPELSFPPPTDGEELKLPAETVAPQRPPHRAVGTERV